MTLLVSLDGRIAADGGTSRPLGRDKSGLLGCAGIGEFDGRVGLLRGLAVAVREKGGDRLTNLLNRLFHVQAGLMLPPFGAGCILAGVVYISHYDGFHGALHTHRHSKSFVTSSVEIGAVCGGAIGG